MNDLIDRFCSVPPRRLLYEEVQRHTSILLAQSDDGFWHSKTKDSATTIYCARTDHPEASLAHELLHAKLKCNGYKQYSVAICTTCKKESIKWVLEILDNELQHHKFYSEFLALGFKPAHMYADSDAEVWKELHRSIVGLKRTDPPESFLYRYVTIIAPGGAGGKNRRKEAGRRLRKRCPPGYWERLCTIGDLFTTFGAGATLDAGQTIVRVLVELEGYDPAWVGWNEKFPDSGLFIGQPFTLD